MVLIFDDNQLQLTTRTSFVFLFFINSIRSDHFLRIYFFYVDSAKAILDLTCILYPLLLVSVVSFTILKSCDVVLADGAPIKAND